VVSDFGISRQIEDNVALRTQIGSLGYMSPEQCDPRNGYDEKVDIWAVGVIAYIL
jgi:serine/threonine protein kinase